MKKKILKKGIFMISLDTELIWGITRYTSIKKYNNNWFKERINIIKILKLFEKYKIPATWALVCHLFLNECDGKHKDIKKGDDWIKYDPGTNIKKDPLFYGKDILDLIKNNKINHEIACHSFSHIDFDKIPKEVAYSELKKCKTLFNKEKLKMNTFIFPREKFGNLEILEKFGIKLYRKKEDDMRTLFKYIFLRKLFRGLRAINFFTSDKFQSIKYNQNLWEIPANSSLILPINKITVGINNKYLIKIISYLNKIKFYKTINKAIRYKKIVHITTHPYHFYNEEDINQLEKMLKYVNKKLEKNQIDILSMSAFYKKYLK